MTASTATTLQKPQELTADGRHRRSAASREKIVKALTDLVRETAAVPGAEAIATQAGVGIRTVFRHFNDMETLYREMAQNVDALLMPLMSREYRASHWRDQVRELTERRACIYEQLEPFQTAIIANRNRSEFLDFHYSLTLEREKKTLQRLLPSSIVQNRSLFAAIESAISFDTWCRLRQSHQFDLRQCIECMRLSADALLEQHNTAAG